MSTVRGFSRPDPGIELTSCEPSLRGWNPLWLNSNILSAFCGLYGACLISLLLLYHYSTQSYGISTRISSNHYIWTYGPTALLVVIAALWARVDYYCRRMAPWQQLSEGAVSVEQSLLLDYVSPILPVTFLKSFHMRDWAVSASILGSILLRIAIVSSTGLVVLTPTALTDENVTIFADTTFGGSTLRPRLAAGAILQYYGVVNRGIEYPYGTTANLAYETVDISSLRENTVVTAYVKAFMPQLECENAMVRPDLTIVPSRKQGRQPSLALSIELAMPSCPTISTSFTGRICNPYIESCPPRVVASAVDFDLSLRYKVSSSSPTEEADPCASLKTVMVVDFRYQPTLRENQTTYTAEVANVSAVVCRPSHSYETIALSLDTTKAQSSGGFLGVVRVGSDAMQAEIPGLSDHDLTTALNQNLMAFPVDLYRPVGQAIAANGQATDPFGALIVARSGGAHLSTFLNTDALQESTRAVYQGLVAQLVSQGARYPSRRQVPARSMHTEQRLHLRLLTVFFMSIVFVLLMITAVVILALKPRFLGTHDPSMILTNLTIIASSPDLQDLFSTSGHLDDQLLGESLRGIKFATNKTGNCISVETNIRVVPQLLSCAHPSSLSWWRPLPISIPAIVVSGLLPLAVIVALEGLQKISNTSQGIATIDKNSSLNSSLPSFIAATIMIVIAMLFDSISFTSTVMAPFRALRHGDVTAHGLMRSFLGKAPLAVLLQSLKYRHFDVIFATIAAGLSSVLTIVVSGLFVIQTVPVLRSITVSRLDDFAKSWDASNDNLAGTIFSFIEWQNDSYPTYTYDELAYPALSQIDVSKSQDIDSFPSLVTLTLPARRASLDCELISSEKLDVEYSYVSTLGAGPVWAMSMTANVTPPVGCHYRDEFGNPIAMMELHYATADFPRSGRFFAGDMLRLGVDEAHCPSIAFMFGQFEYEQPESTDATAFVCSQSLETVDTQTTFMLPGLNVDPNNAPVVDESSVAEVQHTDYDLTLLIENWECPFDNLALVGSASDSSTNYEDESHFFGTLLLGKDGIPEHELVGSRNSARLLNATLHTYRKYMAQVINFNMRRTLSKEEASATENTYEASLQDSSILRLKLNNPSKIALQAFLGAICFCAVATFTIGWDMRYTVSHNPCTIAGVMSLLAGSHMCDPSKGVLPSDAQSMTDKELEKALDGWTFSLGWCDRCTKKSCCRFGIDVGPVVRAESRDKTRPCSRETEKVDGTSFMI